MPELLLVTTTTGDHAVAERIAAELVDRRLAACIQIAGPVRSYYRWQGELENTEEYVCSIKTTRAKYSEVEACIAELHPYDVPELIATPIVAASDAYRDWLLGEL